MSIKLKIFFVIINAFIINQINIIGQGTTPINWIKTSELDGKFSTHSLFKTNMITRLTNEFDDTTWNDSHRTNNDFSGGDELSYYLNSSNSAIYDEINDFITIKDYEITGQLYYRHYAGQMKEFDYFVLWVPVYKDKIASFGFDHYYYLKFNNQYANDNYSFNNFDYIRQQVTSGQSWDVYSPSNGTKKRYVYINNDKKNPVIQKNIYLRTPNVLPNDPLRFFNTDTSESYYQDWSPDTSKLEICEIKDRIKSWNQTDEKSILFLAKSPLPKIDHPTKYFTNSESTATPHNYLFDSDIVIKTDQRVKILVLHFYKKNVDGITYTLLDKTRVAKFPYIENDPVEYTNGIKQITIPKYHITEAGDYAMELGIVDKFNKMYLFEPQYFKIVDPTITVTGYEFSNNGTDFHVITSELFNSYINTNNDNDSNYNKIKFKLKTKIDNLYEYTANGIFDFNNTSTSYGNGTLSDPPNTFYVYPEIALDGTNKTISGNIGLTLAKDTKVQKTITYTIAPVNINYVPDINAISIGNVEPIPVSIKAPARQRELLLWSNDTFREDSTIWDNDESLNGKDFTINNTVMFNIPIDISSDVNLIKLTVRRKNTSGSLPLIYYFKINTSRTIVTCYDNTGTVETDFSIGLIANGNTIIQIIKPVYYSDFFDENKDIPEKSFPVDLFGKEFDAQVKGIKYFDHNYYNNVLITNTSDIQTEIINNLNKNGIEIFFDDDYDNNERAISSKQNDKIELAKSMNTPPFPSRVVYSNFRRDVANNDMVDFYIKPKLTSETCLNDTYNYKIIVMKDSVYQEKYKNDENFIKTKLLEDLNVAGDIPDNNVWNYNATDKMYISKWISWSGNNSPLHMGNDKFRFIENKSNDPEGKLHFFTIMKYKDADGMTYKNTNEYRHSAVRIDDSLTVVVDPGDLFDGNNNPVIHERVTFTKDVFVPEGKSLTFGYGSCMSTTKWKKIISNVELANNVKIIVRGTLNINNKYGHQSATKYIYLGPNGLNPDPDNVTKIDNSGDAADYLQIDKNGMWGGIYVLNTGVLKIDGGIINGAYDGIILYSLSDSVKTTLKNCEIKYNEIGLQLYNSYPVIGDNVFVEGNLLYGVKEDNMIGKGGWKFNNGNLDKIKGNYINYYDDKGAVIK